MVGNSLKKDMYILADLVEKYIGKDPAAIRFWVNQPISNIGVPRDLIHTGNIRELIDYLEGELYGQEKTPS